MTPLRIDSYAVLDYMPGSSAEGPYNAGTGTLFSRKYTQRWAR